ncbi:MAG: RND transporter [Rhodospirillaceae bacterium]|nr:MAG: RND transporter [Rhodospirillaceae bacterium]
MEDRVIRYANWVIRYRFVVMVGCILVTVLAGLGMGRLQFEKDYRVYFGENNPQLQAFEALQAIYGRNDNVLFVLAPKDGRVFTRETLAAVRELTEEAWKTPHSTRVDSITNYQHTRAEGDNLIVSDLVPDATKLSPETLAEIRRVALGEPLLLRRLISETAHVTGINVTIYLKRKNPKAEEETVAYARKLAEKIRGAHPNVAVYLSGLVMLNAAFAEASIADMENLTPLMYGILLVAMILMLRSFAGVLGTVSIILLAVVTAMGLAGWLGILLTPSSVGAPTVIMTLAVADSVHILISMFAAMGRGMNRNEALVESLRINMQPVFLTSLTTVIGFLTMNFSDAPPFQDLGNITAMGVVAAFFYSILFLPALVASLPVRVPAKTRTTGTPMNALANFVIARRKPLLYGMSALIVLVSLMIPRIEFNDEWVGYFDEKMEFRQHTDFVMNNLTGISIIDYSLEAAESGGIAEPDYLENVARFTEWYRQQPGVIHVNTLTDTFKRLNKNMHGDDPDWYRLPSSRELAAQYLLLYELSLPFGLDLNNQINIDRSAARFVVTTENMNTEALKNLAARSEAWLRENTPSHMWAEGSGGSIMFAHISERNIRSMLIGTSLAVLLIGLTLVLALRSIKIGMLSMIPNLVPMLLAFGLWGAVVGQINVSAAIVAAICLGIVVDDSVHFLSKYLRAMREMKLTSEDAVHYAFATVGKAMVTTSVILILGFLVLTLSTFQVNVTFGLLSAVTIALALLSDFLFLPPLLMWLGKKNAPLP